MEINQWGLGMDILSETTILIQINSGDQTHFHLLKEVTEMERPRKVDKQEGMETWFLSKGAKRTLNFSASTRVIAFSAPWCWHT